MNKQFLKYIFLLAAAGSILTSCSKSFVNKQPLASLTDTEALSSAAVLSSARSKACMPSFAV